MIIRSLLGKSPKLSSSVRCAENAAVLGDVTLGEDVSLWYHCTLRGDVDAIVVGDGSNIQDGCVLHCGFGDPTRMGKDVVVGHNAIVHGCTVEDNCLIGMGAVVLDGAVIGEGSLVGAGALVTGGKIIPPGSLVMGVPGKVVRSLTDAERQEILEHAAYYVDVSREELPLLQGVPCEDTGSTP